MLLRPAATLSPGERTRAALALLQGRASTSSSWTSRRTTWTCRPSNSWSRPGRLRGHPLLVTHDRCMLDVVRVTRRLEVADGKVTER